MRRDRVLEGVVLIDLDLDTAAADVAEQLMREQRLLDRVGDVVRERRPRQEQRALHREQLRIERRNRARRRSDADHDPATLERIERAHEGIPADAVEYDVHALTA